MLTTEQIKVLFREGQRAAFYHDSAWRHKRKEILYRDRNECKECKRHGIYKRANTVHHIKHLEDFPELAYTDSNLESLCRSCHRLMHPEKEEKMQKPKKQLNEEWFG